MQLLNNDSKGLYEVLSIMAKSMINTENLTSRDFLNNAFEAAFELIPEAQKGSLFLMQGERYLPISSRGYDIDLLNKLSFTKEDVFIGFEQTNVNHITAYETYLPKRDDSKFTKEILDTFKALGTYSNFVALYAPIVYNGTSIGLLSLENFNSEKFSPSSKDVLKIYAQMISNFYTISRQSELERLLFSETVESLVSAIEIKDAYTEGHAKRVVELSHNLALAMKLPPGEIEKIKLAALLHDVGKIGIPTQILNKPGPLSDIEFDMIKTHPEKAHKVLSKISNFTEILDLVLCHHEHFDGSGYPNGLVGNQIPFGAQIILVSDAFDAMTSKRAYRDAMTSSRALEILKENAGTQFHPDIVNVALSVFR